MSGLRIVAHPRSSKLYVRGTFRGKAVYESTGTDNPDLADDYRRVLESQIWQEVVHGIQPSITFATAAADYLEAEPRRPDTVKRIQRLMPHFGMAMLSTIDQRAVDRAYKVLLTPKAGNATKLRAVLTPLKAVLEFAAVRGHCGRPAFKAPKQPRPQTHFLRPDQASRLVAALPPNLRPFAIFLIGTGCRMSEALELEWPQVDLIGARAVLLQKQGTRRHADLPPAVLRALAALPHREGRVFRKAQTKMQKRRGILPDGYRDTDREGGGQIKTAWSSAAAAAGLPGTWREWTYRSRRTPQRRFLSEITPHDLRHTWASWHYCVHRDLVKLRIEGGWDTVTMVERYAHLMPEAYRPQILAWWEGREEPAAPMQATG